MPTPTMLEVNQEKWSDLMRLVKNTQHGECLIEWQDGLLMSPVKFYLKKKEDGKVVKVEISLTSEIVMVK